MFFFYLRLVLFALRLSKQQWEVRPKHFVTEDFGQFAFFFQSNNVGTGNSSTMLITVNISSSGLPDRLQSIYEGQKKERSALIVDICGPVHAYVKLCSNGTEITVSTLFVPFEQSQNKGFYARMYLPCLDFPRLFIHTLEKSIQTGKVVFFLLQIV